VTTHRVVTSRRADDDIDEAVSYYVAEGAPDAAVGFIDALEAARNVLAEHPWIGSTRLAMEIGVDEVRSLALRRFPYVVVYTVDNDAVRVHRVLHTHRDILSEFLGS